MKLTGAICALILTAGGLVAAPSAASAATTGATVTSAWTDVKGRDVFVRVGTYDRLSDNGFGMTKIINKHGIRAVSTLKFISRAPDGGSRQGDDREYIAYANKSVCKSGRCTVVESIPVRLIMSNIYVSSYYGVTRIDGALGIKTAYCQNPDRSDLCPSWVDYAFKSASSLSTPGSDGLTSGSSRSTDATVWSYAPMHLGAIK